MASVKDHYDAHLSKVYGWMLGNFDERVQQQTVYFQQQQLKPAQNNVAIDLGCGNGIQSVALANLGYQVIAVDFSHYLLDELRVNASDKPVTVVESDITDLRQYQQPAELMVCMGDTLTHFETTEQVEHLFNEWFRLLLPQGKLVLSFRELAIEPEPEKRSIPVRSDDDRILTCFLEYHAGYVLVHDLLYERSNGQWQFTVSAYKKLRLYRNHVVGFLVKAGFRVSDARTLEGMLHIIAEK